MKKLARLIVVLGLFAGTALPLLADGPGNPPWPPRVVQTLSLRSR